MRASSLEQVRGIGPAKAKALLRRFGTLSALREAPREEIEKTPSVSASDAERIYAFLHAEKDQAKNEGEEERRS